MRGHLASDAGVRPFSAPDGLERLSCGEVGNVQPRVRELLGKLDVAIHNAGFSGGFPAAQSQTERRRSLIHGATCRQPGVLRVLDDWKTEFAAQAETFAHDVIIKNRLAIV